MEFGENSQAVSSTSTQIMHLGFGALKGVTNFQERCCRNWEVSKMKPISQVVMRLSEHCM